MTAGRRDQLITLQTYTSTQGEYGEEVATWTDLGTEWVAVFYGRGDERRQAAMEQGSQAATFQMLASSRTLGASIRDRIILDGRIWDILGISPHTPKRGLVEFTAVSSGQEAEIVLGEPGAFDFSDPVNSGLLTLLLEDA